MPRAEILSKQAVYTLGLLHAELAGKLLANKREAIRLRTAMMQVEAVVKMLQPRFNVANIAAAPSAHKPTTMLKTGIRKTEKVTYTTTPIKAYRANNPK